MNNSNYYVYEYIPKFYTKFDWNTKPGECFKDWSHTVFSNAINDTNDENQIKQLSANILAKDEFMNLLSDKRWSSRFIKYCYVGFMQEMLISRLSNNIHQHSFSVQIKMKKAVDEAIQDYDKIFSELRKELDLMEVDGKIKKFHNRFAKVCADKAVREAMRDESYVLEMLINKGTKKANYDGLLNLEMFISANEQG